MNSAQEHHLSCAAPPVRELLLTVLALQFLTIIHLLGTEIAFLYRICFKRTSPLLLNKVKKVR